jgi:hypothetical protein
MANRCSLYGRHTDNAEFRRAFAGLVLVELAGKAQLAFSGMDEGCPQRRGGQTLAKQTPIAARSHAQERAGRAVLMILGSVGHFKDGATFPKAFSWKFI